MKALILAAGLGKRMGYMTGAIPKAMVEVAGIPLVDRIADFLDNGTFSEIGIVVGYQGELLRRHLEKKNFKVFVNNDYEKGNILSMLAAKDFLDDDFLMTNVDHIYPAELLGHILKNVFGITAMCDFDRDLVDDDMKVKLRKDGCIEKISKTLTDYDGGYIGMTFCGKEMIGTYKKAALEVVKISGEQSSVESLLGRLAETGEKISVCDTSGLRWLEIDTQEDYNNAVSVLEKGRR